MAGAGAPGTPGWPPTIMAVLVMGMSQLLQDGQYRGLLSSDCSIPGAKLDDQGAVIGGVVNPTSSLLLLYHNEFLDCGTFSQSNQYLHSAMIQQQLI